MLLGIDLNGKVVTETVNYELTYGTIRGKKTARFIRVFDKDGKLTGKIDIEDMDAYSVTAVSDIKGNINYVATGKYDGGSSSFGAKVYDLETETYKAAGTDGSLLSYENIFAYENNGKVYTGCGGYITYIATRGAQRYGSFRIYEYDSSTGKMKKLDSPSTYLPGVDFDTEYGMMNSNTILTSVSYNDPDYGYNKTQVYNLGETKETKTEKISKRSLSYDSDYTIVKSISGSFSADSVVTAVLSEVNAGETKTMQVKGTKSDAYLEKSLNLEAGRTYYYEYDTTAGKDILSVTAKLNKNGGATEGYSVEKVYKEDFNDSDLDSFFTYSSGTVDSARYYMVEMREPFDFTGSGSIEFTVPSGYEAVLKFDYSFCAKRGTGKGYFTLQKGSKDSGNNEERWLNDKESVYHGELSGSYTSKNLLTSGKYTLSGHLTETSNHDENNFTYCYIDNIEIDLVKKASSYPQAVKGLELKSSKSKSGDFTHISGSFTAPEQTVSYGLLETDIVSQNINVPGEYTYSIPSGRTALLLKYNITVHAYAYNDRQYCGGTTFNGIDRAYYAYKDTDYSYAYSGYPHGTYDLYGYSLTGEQKITVTSKNSSNSSRMVNSLYAVLSKAGANVPANALNRKFFIADDNLYYEDITGGGIADFRFTVGSGSTDIGNLRIYTIENGQKIYLENSSFKSDTDLTGWSANNASVSIEGKAINMDDAAPLVYKKGEYVNYNIHYSDYENDTSKAGYWIYTHEPYNDGLNPISGEVLTEPVHRFYYDGKYTLTHYQYDSTGNEAYDLKSNECTITFYIEGNAEAPWIEYIKTSPEEVEDGDDYKLIIGVDDKEKDPLNLVVEVYKDGTLIDSLTRTGIRVNTLNEYDPVYLDPKYDAEAGLYDIVATVSDETGKGIGSYRFTVKVGKSLDGIVDHTDKWNENRAAYNKANPLKKRADNVFWPGESLELTAWLTGGPTKVTAKIEGTTYSVVMKKTGITDDQGRVKYTASLWDKTMEAYFIKNEGDYDVKFTAFYADGKNLYDTEPVIFKYDGGYYQLKKKK